MQSSICGSLLLIAGLAVGVASCGGNAPTVPTSPTSPATATETFSGNLNQNGAVTHSFSASAAGTISATLSALAPDDTLKVGLSLGTWNGTACTIVIANDTATKGSAVSGTINSSGSFCARVYDVGNVVNPVTYTVTVTHP
jgi:hypothetical protein